MTNHNQLASAYSRQMLTAVMKPGQENTQNRPMVPLAKLMKSQVKATVMAMVMRMVMKTTPLIFSPVHW